MKYLLQTFIFLFCTNALVAQSVELQGRLRVYTESNVWVYVDDDFIGYGSQSIDVTVGKHTAMVKYKVGEQWLSRKEIVFVNQNGANVFLHTLGQLTIKNGQYSLWEVIISLTPLPSKKTSFMARETIYINDVVTYGLYGNYQLDVWKNGHIIASEPLSFSDGDMQEYTIEYSKNNKSNYSPVRSSVAYSAEEKKSNQIGSYAQKAATQPDAAYQTQTQTQKSAYQTQTQTQKSAYQTQKQKSTYQVSSEKSDFPSHVFVEYQYAPKANTGVMLGWCKRVGVYAAFRMNIFRTDSDKSTSQSDRTKTNYAMGYEGYSATGGIMIGCSQWMYLHAGIGYGKQKCDGSVSPFSSVLDSKGLAAEVGVLFRVSYFNFSVGYNTLCNAEYKLNPLGNVMLGIGFNL